MYDLERALQDHDLIILRVIGEWWELDLTGSQKQASIRALIDALSGLDMTVEAAYLGPEEAEAFYDLVRAGGRMPVAAFERKHGEVRLMGPGRLEREEPWLDPVSPAEGLWYRGFLFRAFDESDERELVEYYYLPNELFRHFQDLNAVEPKGPERDMPALLPAGEPESSIQAGGDAVDDLTAILGAAQTGLMVEGADHRLGRLLLHPHRDRLSLLITLSDEMNLLRETDEGLRPTRHVLDWLRKSREAQLRDLADAWSHSVWNDLCHTPGLRCEGSSWQNDPILARTTLLDALPRAKDWFRLDDLIASIRAEDPDFQRPDGNYNTWYIRDEVGGGYLAGFENWDLVEGRMLRFMVCGPMHWLGLADLHQANGETMLYRLAPRAVAWLANEPVEPDEIHVPIVVHDDASLLVPFNADRYVRFQVARVADAQPVEAGQPFPYRLTPDSLARATEQGIEPQRVLKFLAESSGRPVPASTRRAVERWVEKGTEARLETLVILRVRDQEILDKLRANPKTRPFIAEAMGDLAATIRADDWPELRKAAAQLGLLLDAESDLPIG